MLAIEAVTDRLWNGQRLRQRQRNLRGRDVGDGQLLPKAA
jgi:hypothetical protein